MKKKKLASESGFTILEVLMAATVFITGFTLMISLLDTTISRFSNKELITGTNLAQEIVLTTMTLQDSTSVDTVITRAGINFAVEKRCGIVGNSAQLTVKVFREKTNRKVIELYNEFLFSEKQ